MHPSLEKQAHLSNEDCDSRIFEVETVQFPHRSSGTPLK
jgi:hypothetical protein